MSKRIAFKVQNLTDSFWVKPICWSKNYICNCNSLLVTELILITVQEYTENILQWHSKNNTVKKMKTWKVYNKIIWKKILMTKKVWLIQDSWKLVVNMRNNSDIKQVTFKKLEFIISSVIILHSNMQIKILISHKVILDCHLLWH